MLRKCLCFKNLIDSKGGYIKGTNDTGIKVRKIFIQRDGNSYHWEYNRSIVLIKRIPRKLVENGNFEIENC